MTAIKDLSFVTIIGVDGFNLVHGLVEKIKRENIQLTKERFMPGVEHRITVGDKVYHIRAYYSKDGKSIDKLTVKEYQVQS